MPCLDPPTEDRFSYIGVVTKSGGTPRVERVNTVRRKEPTWGDTDFILKFLDVALPENRENLQRTFSIPTRGPNHLQYLRNATAHFSRETFTEVLMISPYYVGSGLWHPCDLNLWEDPERSTLAFFAWTENMRKIAEIAIQ